MAVDHPFHLRTNPTQTDVVVVGAGPSGCAAAYDLASKGIRVKLLDRTEFPRHKACAGGLTVKTIRALRYSIDPVVQTPIRNLAVSCRMRHPKLLSDIDPICHLVERAAFDLFCFNRTVSAGARFEVVKRIDAIVETKRSVTLVTDQGSIRSRFLVGADGVHSRIRKLSGRPAGVHTGFAVEGIVDRVPPKDFTMGFDFSWVKGGYGWVFPKADHISIGLYTMRPDEKITRGDLEAYADDRKIGMPMAASIIGYPLGLGGWRYRPGRGRVLLVGDAAGLVDPLLGEGLYHAISSGQQAAAAIGDVVTSGGDACVSYGKRLLPIQRDLRFSRLVADIFYRLPELGHLLLTSPAARIPLMKGFSVGLPLLDIFRYGYRFWFGPTPPAGDNAEK
jgi:geranylgeranyl reductase family protein